MDIELLPELRQVDPDTFEDFVAYLWERFGWNARITQSSRDGGIDVIAVQHSPTKQTQGIQAKRYAQEKNVSVTTVREVAGQLNDGFDSVAVVTTGGFTGPAEEDADRLGVRTVGGREIQEMVEEADISAEDLSQFISITENSESPEDSEQDNTVTTVSHPVRKGTEDPEPSESTDSEDSNFARSQSVDDDIQNEPDIEYTSDKSDIEYQRTDNETLTHEEHIEILSIHLDEYSNKYAFLNYFFEKDDSIGRYQQINGPIYNLTGLSKEEVKIARSHSQDKPLEIDSTVGHGTVMLSEIHENRVTPKHMAPVAEELLDDIYHVDLEDIVAVETYAEDCSEVWEWL